MPPGRGPGELERRAAQRAPLAGAPEQPPLELRRPRGLRVGRAGHAAGDDGRVERAHVAEARHRPCAIHRARRRTARRARGRRPRRRSSDGVGAGDADAPQRNAGEEVDGAVERIDHPAQSGRSSRDPTVLLGDDVVTGAAPREYLGHAASAARSASERGPSASSAQSGRRGPSGRTAPRRRGGRLRRRRRGHRGERRRPWLRDWCDAPNTSREPQVPRERSPARNDSSTPRSHGPPPSGQRPRAGASARAVEARPRASRAACDDRGGHGRRAAFTRATTVVAVASSVYADAVQPWYRPSWPASRPRSAA